LTDAARRRVGVGREGPGVRRAVLLKIKTTPRLQWRREVATNEQGRLNAGQLVDQLGKLGNEFFLFFGGGFELGDARFQLANARFLFLDFCLLIVDLLLLLNDHLVLFRNFCLNAFDDFFGRKAHGGLFSGWFSCAR
jgi:hypothetical protein